MEKIEFDQERIDKKSYEIGEILDGLTIPEVFSIIGTVIIAVVTNACSQGIDVRSTVCGWLRMLCKHVMGINMEVLEENKVLAN